MSPEQLRVKIRAAAISFTDDLIGLFSQAFVSVADDFQSETGKAPARKAAASSRAKPAAARKAGAKPQRAAGKRNRRSAGELDKTGDKVVRLLKSEKKGLRVEQINKALGTKTRELMRPIQKLLSQGVVRKVGERRATTYFA